MDIDHDALQAFIDESAESLQHIEGDFVALEKDPANKEIINRIFRPIHSLKGNSGFFGLVNINKFSHRLENLLDSVRKDEVQINRTVIDLLLQGVEHLEQMLVRAQADPTDIAFRPDEEALLATVEEIKPRKVVGGSIQSVIQLEKILQQALDQGVKIHSQSRIMDLLNRIEIANREIEALLAEIQRSAESSPHGASRYRYLDQDVTELAGHLLAALDGIRAKQPRSRPELKALGAALATFSGILKEKDPLDQIDQLGTMINFLDDELMLDSAEYTSSIEAGLKSVLGCLEAVPDETIAAPTPPQEQKLGEILVEGGKITSSQLEQALRKQKKIGEILVEDGAIGSADLKAAMVKQAGQALAAHQAQASTSAEISKTIRISQSKLDVFADKIGQLFINIDSFNYLKKQLEVADTDYDIMSKFTSTVTTFDEMVESLHESVMEIRKVPVRTLFQRFPKVIRQLAVSVSKDIEFTTSGEDTVIDKDLLEKIENPLVHILRNSVDHGIETPEERERSGKTPRGILELKASTDEDFVTLVIRDDGRGIDPRKMKQAAVHKGFLKQEEADRLTDSQLVNLIFRPGFSTAERISDISGRGVGMDVVLSGLRECNGTVNVDSQVGLGTTVTIKIPLTKTLVAKNAMIVKAAGRVYAIDSSEISSTLEVTESITSLFEGERCISFNNKIYTVIDANAFFFGGQGKTGDREPGGGSHRVFIVSDPFKMALLVDEVISHQKIVVKDFNNSYHLLREIKGINGYTILGNQDIALIMELKKVAQAV